MDLTKRKKQFLDKLMDLYQQTKLPVHYETLAQKIGVSKWTAYDMVKELEKLHYLTRDYALNRGETGRSQVVYLPTEKAYDLFTETRVKEISLEEWEQTKTSVKHFLVRLNCLSRREAIQKILEEISITKVHITFCAYIIGLLLLHLEGLGKKTDALIKNLVHGSPTSEMKLTMFVGTIVGTIIQNMNDDIGVEVTALVSRYLTYIHTLSENEKEMLANFLNERLL
ncbi:Lrp/AsnC family transcriptional regulator [Ferdinandcohnia sp. SAFN-114]|uniref:Lrp/AsnC family transcriptional regulator n=1 Tax=Ferdinandcohnia sp. SAFN-114 TaxID=3387275 RepID=UPI003F7E1BE8